jgi:hypothetical protein
MLTVPEFQFPITINLPYSLAFSSFPLPLFSSKYSFTTYSFTTYSFTTPRATSTTVASSTVAGTLTFSSYFPCTPFSTNSLKHLLSVLPDRVLGIMPRPCIMPPSAAMAPICSRTRPLTSLKSWAGGVAGILSPEEPAVDVGWTKAKGRWPFREPGMPTTQASPTEGCERMACSIAPDEEERVVSKEM